MSDIGRTRRSENMPDAIVTKGISPLPSFYSAGQTSTCKRLGESLI